MEELNKRLEHLKEKEERTEKLVSQLLNTEEDMDINLEEYGLEGEELLNYFKRLGEV